MNSIEEMLAAAARMLDQRPEIRVQADSAAVGLVARTSAPTKDLPALLVRKSNVELVVLMGAGMFSTFATWILYKLVKRFNIDTRLHC
jgi:hypothetical protein